VSEVLVRPAALDELPRLARLADAALGDDVVSAGKAERMPAGDRVFVAECEGRTAGYAAVHQDDATLVLDQLVVAATDRGRHVGHTLLDWVEGFGVSLSLTRVRVPLTGADQRAREFYLRRGYAESDGALERELTHT
jgi:N-acetylglutamate synthase-like GNAT family acetyltransferase